MDELKKLLENAGVQEITIDPITNRGVDTDQINDIDLDWGDELIEDLKSLIRETPSGKISHEELQAVIQQYEA